tara:strand:- start:57 stop:1076 length:1020 start_codon:yes stop_codon:yes gene_type:complete
MSLNKRLIETKTAGEEAKFAVTTWTGNATSGSDTRDINVGFAPDIYWIRGRNYNTNVIINRVRGGGKGLYPHTSQPEATDRTEVLQDTGIQLVGTSVNYNGETSVMWSWGGGTTEETNTDGSITTTIRANKAAGYSVIEYTGNGTQGATIGHGLDSAPEFFVIKNLDNTAQTESFNVYNVVSGNSKYLFLNSDTAGGTTTAYDNTTPSSSTISIGNYSGVNYSGDKLVCFAFHSVSGYSKIGSYTGSGSSGNAQNIGFQPDMVIIKSTTHQYNWNIYDTKRPSGSLTGRYLLIANSSGTEITSSTVYIDITSTGFSFPNAYDGTNKSGETFLYMAWKIT